MDCGFIVFIQPKNSPQWGLTPGFLDHTNRFKIIDISAAKRDITSHLGNTQCSTFHNFQNT